MNLKTKRIFALIVKLVLCVSCIHAQSKTDSLKKITPASFTLYNKMLMFPSPKLPANLPGNFYAKQLPFFCSSELKLQKTVGFPIKFRLSTVEYCDKLEGKKN